MSIVGPQDGRPAAGRPEGGPRSGASAEPTRIHRLLVANRGEIARRIFRTCRDLGVGTVAVYSDPDAGAPHVREADAAVRLPGSAAADTYLRADLLVAAALAAGADAVHPGYGFGSENADFARAVEKAGLTWVGPPAAAIEAMGSKVEAKRLMARAGVPVLAELDPAAVTAADLPVLVKASAGGGGRGMRIVRTLAGLPAALDAARSEAAAAFGDPTVFCEPYLEGGRHIEVQVLADSHGTVWALGERECSIQRRHQKVIEEAPSPAVDDAVRQRLVDAAVAAARAIGYVGAGTVEFLATVPPGTPGPEATSGTPGPEATSGSPGPEATSGSPGSEATSGSPGPWATSGSPGSGAASGTPGPEARFFFLEMNTRLQVEHPVTECVTGLDLVRLQVAVAEGERLPAQPPAAAGAGAGAPQAGSDAGATPGTVGHAVEVRLYAEDPAADWRPDSGTLHRFAVPGVAAEFAVPASYGLRLDSGVVDGSVVGVHYDPMLAKVIAWAPTRDEAVRRLAAALAGAHIHGLITNRDLLVRVLRHPAFRAGETDTGFFDRHGLSSLAEPLAGPEAQALSALAAALADAAANRAAARVQRGVPGGWRNVPSQPLRRSYQAPSGRHDIEYRVVRGRLEAPGHPGVTLVSATPEEVVLEAGGVTRRFAVARYPGLVCVDSGLGPVALRPVDRFPEPDRRVAAGSLVAPMPGTVVSVAVAEGDTVRAGQPLLVLEAMKMQHPVAAPAGGVVRALRVVPGSQVEAGAVLAVVTANQ